MNFENINNNTNKNLSTMTTLETVANRYNINLFELYNSIMSEAPEMESENPTCYEKVMEGQKVPKYTSWFDGYGYFDWEDALEFSPKTSTKRYDRRDKSRHGRKYKKVNNACGKHWNEIYINSSKCKKAVDSMIQEGLMDFEVSKLIFCEAEEQAHSFYINIIWPTTKSFNEIIVEILDQFSENGYFLDKYILNCIYEYVEYLYKLDIEREGCLLKSLDSNEAKFGII